MAVRTPSRAAVAVLAALLLALVAVPAARAQASDEPVLALWPQVRAQPVTTASGASARFDAATVLPELGADTRVLLAPPDPRTRGDYYDAVLGPLRDLARDAELDVLVVTGLAVHVVRGTGSGAGEPGPSGIAGLRTLLSTGDVTDLLVLGARSLRDPDTPSTPDPVTETRPATDAEAAPVVAALRTQPRWAAPGADAGTTTAERWDRAVPGTGLRLAFLPAAEPGAPQPDLLPALAAAFPGETVGVVRGRWIDLAGPEQAALTSARNYALGRADPAFRQWGTPVDALVLLVLDRATTLITADPFQRDPAAPTTTTRLLQRWVPRVALALAAVLLVGSGVLASRRWRSRVRTDGAAARARALAELARLDEELLDALGRPEPDGAGGARGRRLAAAAERRDTARTLWEASPDPGTSAVVLDAVRDARRALAGAAP